MKGAYTSSDSAAAQTAAQDLIQLLAASNVAVEIIRIELESTLIADERNLILLHRGTAAGGTAGAEEPLDPGMAAADSVVTFFDTTQNTPANILKESYWSILAPWVWLPTPEEQIIIPGGGSFTVELGETITSTGLTASITWREIG